MQPFTSASRAASLSLLLLLLPATLAQSNPSNQNITIRFFPDPGDAETSCSYTDSEDALTFTTASIPLMYHCFDFPSFFDGNKTQGFVNQTGNLARGSHMSQEPGIHWQLFNKDKFSPQANYSRVLYRQHVTNPINEDDQPGRYADRLVTIYPGPGCIQVNPANKTELLPWYGFSCWSEDQGSCGVMEYSIRSFSIQPGRSEEDRDRLGACWDFAVEGGAAPRRSGMVAGLGALFIGLWVLV